MGLYDFKPGDRVYVIGTDTVGVVRGVDYLRATEPVALFESVNGKITDEPFSHLQLLVTPTGGMIHGQGEKEQTVHGAVRESAQGRGRFDLLPYESLEALAIWYELGAAKYAERNWEKGLSVKDCINRMIRHALKAGNGWTDEDHLAAVMWNAAAAITMMKRRPDCNDHPWMDGSMTYTENRNPKDQLKKERP